jgi:hypothetical protein
MEFIEGHLLWPQRKSNLTVDFSGALNFEEPHTSRLATDVRIDRNAHFELIRHLALLQRVLQDSLALTSAREGVMEIVMGGIPAIHPLIQEPIHGLAGVFFHNLTEIPRGSIPGGLARNEIPHHLDEMLVGVLERRVFKENSQHFQYVRALEINQNHVSGISIIDSGPTKKIYPVATDCNRHPGFQRLEPPAPTQKASLTTPENDKAPTCLSLDRFLRHLSVPCLIVA